MTLYVILSIVNFQMTLTLNMRVQYTTDKATIYRLGDKYSGLLKANGRNFKSEDRHIAHKTIPLGTKGYLCNNRTRRCVWTIVEDRGPYGTIRRCGKVSGDGITSQLKGRRIRQIRWSGECYNWVVQTKSLEPGWEYRSAFDITDYVADKIGHKSFEEVTFIHDGKKNSLRRVLEKTYQIVN